MSNITSANYSSFTTVVWDGLITRCKDLQKENNTKDQKIENLFKKLVNDIDEKLNEFRTERKQKKITILDYGNLDKLITLLNSQNQKTKIDLVDPVIKKIKYLLCAKHIDELSEFIKSDTNNVDAFYKRGYAYLHQAKYKKTGNSSLYNEAISNFSESIKLNKNYLKGYFYRAQAYYSIFEMEKAIADWTKTINLLIHDINKCVCYYNRGLCYEYLKKYTEALNDFSLACTINPKFSKANVGLKRILYLINSEDKYKLLNNLENSDYQDCDLDNTDMQIILNEFLALDKERSILNLSKNEKLDAKGLHKLIPLAVMNPFIKQIVYDKGKLSSEKEQLIENLVVENRGWVRDGNKSHKFNEYRLNLMSNYMQNNYYQQALRLIFNRLNGQQVSKHLINFLSYLNTVGADKKKSETFIYMEHPFLKFMGLANKQVSNSTLLPISKINTLLEASYYLSDCLDPSQYLKGKGMTEGEFCINAVDPLLRILSFIDISTYFSKIVDPRQFLKWGELTGRETFIQTLISHLNVKKLLEASSYFSDSIKPSQFNTYLSLSLKTASLIDDKDLKPIEEMDKSVTQKVKEKWGEFIEMCKEEGYVLVADEIMTSECPGTLQEAQTIYSNTIGKYILFTSLFGPVGLAIPITISILRKIYLRWGRSTPIGLPPLIDYTLPSAGSFSKTFLGREDVFKKIVQIWKSKKHPILVGKPGAGKTSIFIELGRRIAAKQIPGFEGKALFAGSAALLVSNGMGVSRFQQIMKMLKDHKNNVVLALDEIHAFAQTKDKNLITLLRSATDNNSKESLPYCLFATTQEEYEQYIEKDDSLGRRLTKIDINPLEKNDILYLLNQEAKTISPYLSITEEALQCIYEKAKGEQNASRQLLHKVIVSAECKNAFLPSFEKHHSKSSELKLLLSLYKDQNMNPKEEMDMAKRIIQLKGEVDDLEKKCQKEEQIRTTHNIWSEELIKAKLKRIRDSKKIYNEVGDLLKNDSLDLLIEKKEKELKDLLFLQCFDIPNQIERIKEFELSNGLNSVIDKSFIIELLSANILSKL